MESLATKEATRKCLDKRVTGEITFTKDTNRKNKK